MKKLEEELEKNGFKYKLKHRTDEYYWYEVYNKDYLIANEIGKIRFQKAGEKIINDITVTFEEKELLPCDSNFGTGHKLEGFYSKNTNPIHIWESIIST